MDIRDALRQLMEERAVNRAEIARRAGLTKDQMSKILNKKRKLGADELVAICDAMGMALALPLREAKRMLDNLPTRLLIPTKKS